MKKNALAASLLLLGCSAFAQAPKSTLYQYATIDALLAGAYEGDLTIAALRKKGNFGIGTFNRIDGEMVLVDGVAYKAKSDGTVVVAKPNEKTPFATVTHFKAGTRLRVDAPLTMAALEAWLDTKLTNKNLFYAIRFDGQFGELTTRAISPQDKPYKPLAEVSKTQSVFNLPAQTGTLVAFRSPGFSKGFNVPGYHWHYLARDRKGGGHVLSMSLLKGVVQVASVSHLELKIPTSAGFAEADQSVDRAAELHAVESVRK
ncbi:acetolactate decarboxylase [Massilia glaciei]|nr:acetolactate decarboxylase [Massilia glaciei]